jgi:hypothetical protein
MTENEIADLIYKCSDVESGTAFASFFEMCYVPHPSKGKVSMKEESYEWQRQAAITLLKHKRIISKKSRQVGFSTLLQAYALWRALFFPAQQITIVSIGQQESIEFLEKLEFIYENLPVWLKSPKKEDSKTKIKFKNGSVIKSLANTPKAGRSSSISLLILDEFSEYGKNAKKIMSSASPALGPGFKKAFNNEGLPSQLIICSTVPEVLENNEYMRIYREAIQQGNESQYKIIQPTVHDNEFYADPEWHDMMKTDLGLHAYNREVLGIEVTSLENSFIPNETIEHMAPLHPIRMDFLRPDDVDEEGYAKNEFEFAEATRENYDPKFNYIKGLWIWHNPVPGKEYGIACDVSTGRNTDTSTMHVIDLETLEQCAEFVGRPNTEDFKKIIKTVAIYYNEAKISVERNSMGESICQSIAYGDIDTGVLPYDNFYFERASRKRLIPGHFTSVGNRASMLSLMLNFLTKATNAFRSPLIIHSQRSISEFKSFGWSKRGRLEGISNTDDLVMALAQFCYLREIFFLSSKQTIANGMFSDPDEVNPEEEAVRKKHFAFQESGMDNELEEFVKMGYHVATPPKKDVNVFDSEFDFQEL